MSNKQTLRTYELLMLRGKAWGRRCLAQLHEDKASATLEASVSEALADFGGAMLEKPRAPEPLVEVGCVKGREGIGFCMFFATLQLVFFLILQNPVESALVNLLSAIERSFGQVFARKNSARLYTWPPSRKTG